MDQIIHDFNTSYHAIGEHWRTVLVDNARLRLENTSLTETVKCILEEKEKLQQQSNALLETIKKLQNTITALEQKLVDADEDHKQFSKVSHLVAMEKENAKLRADLEFWMRRNVKADQHIELLHNQAYNNDLKASEPPIVEGTTFHHVQTPEPIPEPVSEPPIPEPESIPEPIPELTMHNTEDVYVEKKIKGVVYLVKDNEVYEKNSEGSIPGKHVATLQLLNTGKTKIKWFKP